MVSVQVRAPSESVSKRLSIIQYGSGKRKVQISTNFLELMNYPKGIAVTEEVIGDGLGYLIKRASDQPNIINKPKRIYQRQYKRRRNCMFETTAKRILDRAIPMNCEQVHVTITPECIRVVPVINQVAERLQKTLSYPFSILGVCTGGIDLYVAQKQGFNINGVVTYRPQEKRDKKDLTEANALACLENIDIKHLINEDIYTVDSERLSRLVGKKTSLVTISLECDDVTPCKAESLKLRSLKDLSSTLDMAVEGIRIVRAVQPAMVLLEQVTKFKDMDIGKIWDLQLRRLGYTTFKACLESPEFGGLSRRKRYFHFASCLPTPFEFPKPKQVTESNLWSRLFLPYVGQMRNVTHSKSLQDGLVCGRLRMITPTSKVAPTLLRSQSRVAKDSVVFRDDNEQLWWPTLEQERLMMSVPDDYQLNAQCRSIASELLGQAVCVKKYAAIISQIRKHIELFIHANPKTQVS